MLRNGAERVVAVEIDPGIIEIGKRFHLERPYHDPRCVVVNDDARSYFATSTEKFDLIAFGLLDSHTTTAMTNARLDHYVYTQESINQVRSLLNPGGVAVLSFEAAKPYIADRMAIVLKQAFGHDPVVFRVPYNMYGWGGLLFVVGDSREAVDTRIAADPKLAGLVKGWQEANPVTLLGTTQAPTDDWPYIYLEKPSIPFLYFVLAAVLALLYLYGRRQLGGAGATGKWDRANWHFFFLGAGFMLLEVQNISKAAVVLGNTWVVNAVIISGVMVMILLANLIAAKFPKLPLAAGLCPARALVRRPVLPRPVAVRVPAVRDEGAGGGLADELAHALQRHRLHPLLRDHGAEGRHAGREPDRRSRGRAVAVGHVRGRHQGTPAYRGDALPGGRVEPAEDRASPGASSHIVDDSLRESPRRPVRKTTSQNWISSCHSRDD